MHLSADEVYELRPSYGEISRLVEGALREKVLGRAQVPPKIAVSTREEVYIHAKPGYLPDSGVAGIKWQSNVGDNPSRGLPNNIGLLILTDPYDGKPLAVMDCAWITALRTPAATLVAIRHLAPAQTREVALVGLGLQGRTHFDALVETGILTDATVLRTFDVNAAAQQGFMEHAATHPGIKVLACGSAEAAVRDADIVITCAAFRRNAEPFVQAGWLKAGCLALPVDVGSSWTPDARARMDRIYTDDIAQTKAFADRGFFQDVPLRLDVELGDVVVGRAAGRTSASETLMCLNLGLSLYDLALGRAVYDRALAGNKGRWLDW